MDAGYERSKILKSLLFSLPFVVIVYALYVNGLLQFKEKTLFAGLSFIFSVIADFRWMDLYDRTFKNDNIWNFGLNSGMKRIPHPVKGEPELNMRFFVFIKWLFMAIIIVFL